MHTRTAPFSSLRGGIVLFACLVLFVVGCQSAALTPTPVPPTWTPIPPSSTPRLEPTVVPPTSAPATTPTNPPPNAPNPVAASSLAIVNGRLFDGTGADPIVDAVVVIRDGRIAAVGPRARISIPSDAQVVDVQGGTILPGFINAHVHRGYERSNLEAWARDGVTTVRDLNPSYSASGVERFYALRDELGKQPQYARIVGASLMMTAPDGYGALPVTSVEDARAKTNAMLDAGADLIKTTVEDNLQGRTWTVLTPDAHRAIVQVAHARGVPVSVHVSRSKQVELALDAGVDDLAHMSVDPLSPDLARRVVAAGVYWVPTLELWQGVGWGAQPTENLRLFVQSGGKVALGTDYAGYTTPFQLGMPIHEMEYMQAAGMTPREIIVAATRNAAHVCNRDQTLGTLESGKIADLLVVAGDPLADIHALGNVRLVVHNGVIIRQGR